jgi:uncharacterized membrane protein (UPF0136 family)
MLGSAKIYFIVFGLLTITGGLIGFLKAGSTISLISGGVAGLLLLTAAYLIPGNLAVALGLALVISFLLAGRFIPNFITTSKMMPAGMMSILSVLGIVMALLAWLKR